MYRNFLFSFVLSCFCCGYLPYLSAQTNISGIINTYYQVTAFSAVNNSMTVSNTTGLASGDEVLVIQMQGAIVSQANNASYGAVSDIEGAGTHELARICEINGNEVVFDSSLVFDTSYAVSGNIQLVSVPQYTNAIVNGTLTASAWDGNTGGILILRAGTLTLNAAIDVDGLGFRGGGYQNASNACNGFFFPSNYAYTTFQDGGRKGEGIVTSNSLSGAYGKGSAANGGGGGNNHNAGGGGGGNGGAGGLGGENETSGFGRCKGPHPGQSGRALGSRMYMGGGGGAGHGNNNLGTGGSAGGGIVIIIANNLIAGTSNRIRANGLDAASGLSDGSGGGGAGGTIQLLVNSYTGNFQVLAEGGDGGSVNNEGLNFCMGPGGGGGGGVIVPSNPLPANVSTSLTGGSPGTSTNIGSSCSATNTNQGATAGGNGFININGFITQAFTDFLCEPLTVQWGEVWAEKGLAETDIHAQVIFEEAGNVYELEKSPNGVDFEILPLAYTRSTDEVTTHYQWKDGQLLGGKWYYRIKQTNAQGLWSYSPTVSVELPFTFQLQAFPNPIQNGQGLTLRGTVPHKGILHIKLYNQLGQILSQQNLPLSQDLYFENHWDLPPLPAGTYFLRAQFEGLSWYHRMVISQ